LAHFAVQEAISAKICLLVIGSQVTGFTLTWNCRINKSSFSLSQADMLILTKRDFILKMEELIFIILGQQVFSHFILVCWDFYLGWQMRAFYLSSSWK
jgi:hypothetical protein